MGLSYLAPTIFLFLHIFIAIISSQTSHKHVRIYVNIINKNHIFEPAYPCKMARNRAQVLPFLRLLVRLT